MKFVRPKLPQFSPGLLLAAGFTASILACALAGALPDRLQPAGFSLGLVLVFTYAVATMIHLTPGNGTATVGQWVNDCLERLVALRSAQAGEGVPRALAGETKPARAA